MCAQLQFLDIKGRQQIYTNLQSLFVPLKQSLCRNAAIFQISPHPHIIKYVDHARKIPGSPHRFLPLVVYHRQLQDYVAMTTVI